MAQKYFIDPFAISGDRTTVPNDAPPTGAVSYSSGFGVDYELDPATNPNALNVPRSPFNQILFDITNAIQILQQHGFPDFIASADNAGSPFPYDINSTVRYNGVNYYSKINNNMDTPPTANWGIVSYTTVVEPTGTGKDFWGSTLPSGYVWANGTTIGSASSGATGLADASTSDLFTLLWTSLPQSTLPIQNSDGSAGSRGVSAAADFAANKRLPVPDKRENVSVASGTMGGTADPGRMTLGGCGFSPVTLGASGGLETVSLTGNQNGTHTHVASTASDGLHSHFMFVDTDATSSAQPINNTHYPARASTTQGSPYSISYNNSIPGTAPTTGITNTAGAHTHAMTINNSGLGSAHQNTQPTIVCNYIIKL